MMPNCTIRLTRWLTMGLLSTSTLLAADKSAGPDPVNNPQSPLMLAGDWVPDDPHEIDFSALPRVPSEHAIVNDVHAENGVNQHNYLVHHNGKLWAMWSDGPG